MARESTRRKIEEPQPESRGRRRPRRALALALRRAADRLDPGVTAPAQAHVSR
jgi:hypothetical protein